MDDAPIGRRHTHHRLRIPILRRWHRLLRRSLGVCRNGPAVAGDRTRQQPALRVRDARGERRGRRRRGLRDGNAGGGDLHRTEHLGQERVLDRYDGDSRTHGRRLRIHKLRRRAQQHDVRLHLRRAAIHRQRHHGRGNGTAPRHRQTRDERAAGEPHPARVQPDVRLSRRLRIVPDLEHPCLHMARSARLESPRRPRATPERTGGPAHDWHRVDHAVHHAHRRGACTRGRHERRKRPRRTGNHPLGLPLDPRELRRRRQRDGGGDRGRDAAHLRDDDRRPAGACRGSGQYGARDRHEIQIQIGGHRRLRRHDDADKRRDDESDAVQAVPEQRHHGQNLCPGKTPS